MRSFDERARVSRYFSSHAADFDVIYESRKRPLRGLRDRLTRGTVVKRLEFVLRHAAGFQAPSIIDVGCGSGRFTVSLAELGGEALGIDFAGSMLDIARERAEAAGVGTRCRFLELDFMDWESEGTFDLTLGLGLFDYVSEPEPLFRKMAEVTKGELIASFPRRLHPLVPLRLARLRASGCPVYFYGLSEVRLLANSFLDEPDIFVLGRDFIVVGSAR